MTILEQRALKALWGVTMRVASSGKRFRRDIDGHFSADPGYKLTERQARYLWLLLDMYRRQIHDDELLSIAQHVKLIGEFPNIYLPGDHRELPKRDKTKPVVLHIPRKAITRYEQEMARGNGRLVL